MAPKPLSEYPRPPEDNGRGVHWSATPYHPPAEDLKYWIDELKAMQIKWVKLLDDGGGSSIELCKMLLDNGMMPVVRIYRERPNPNRLGGREVDAIERLIKVGVHYFETNNEPDIVAEWENNHAPPNWLDIVAENFIYDAHLIQSMGGLPAFPAMGPGSKANGLAKVVEMGRIDIFEKGAWLAIHNYTLNHPLDYPNDPVNQEGRPLTPEEYEALAAWQYSHLTWEEIQELGIEITREDYDKFNRWAWDGRSLEMINELRASKKQPGATIFDDANCFRAWELFGHYVYNTLGFYIPIISTEGGPVVGWGDDGRYAKVNPATQAEWQMEIVRFMQDEAPPWYFTVCTWLLASKPLGDFNPAWDQMSWYTGAWDLQFGLSGELPIVQILKDTPAKVRHELRPASDTAAVTGVVRDSEGRPLKGVVLELRFLDGELADRTVSEADGRFKLTSFPGQYDIFAPWWGPVARDITLTLSDVDVIDVEGMDPPGNFEIMGTVRDAEGNPLPGLTVEIKRNGITHAATETDESGQYHFRPGLAGTYGIITEKGAVDVTVSPDRPTVKQDITEPAPTQYRYVVIEKRLLPPEETGNREAFYGRVLDPDGNGLNGIELEMRWVDAPEGTRFPRVRSGTDPFKPSGYYEFIHTKGTFMIQVVQGDYESDVADGLETARVPGREGERITYEVNFQLAQVGGSPRSSVIRGRVPGGRAGQTVILWKDGAKFEESALDTNRSFQFTQLGAGVYDVELAGIGLIATEIELDGQQHITLDFPLMGAIIGRVEGDLEDRRFVKLVSETYGFIYHSEVDERGEYRFTNLPAGRYRIERDDDILTGLELDGKSILEAPVLRVGMGSEKKTSRIIGRIHDSVGNPTPQAPVSLRFMDEVIATTRSDSEGRFTFANLGPGVYEVEVDDSHNVTGIVLDGRNRVNVDVVYSAVAGAIAKRLDRYYLMATQNDALTSTLVRAIISWMATQPPGTLGFNVTEAQFAQTVVLLGDGLPDSVVALLKDAQCEIIDHRGDLLFLVRQLTPDTVATGGDHDERD